MGTGRGNLRPLCSPRLTNTLQRFPLIVFSAAWCKQCLRQCLWANLVNVCNVLPPRKKLHSPVKICRIWEPLQEPCVFPPQGSRIPPERFILLQGSIGHYLNISYWLSSPHFLFHFIPLLKNLQVWRKSAQESIDGTRNKAVLSICCRSEYKYIMGMTKNISWKLSKFNSTRLWNSAAGRRITDKNKQDYKKKTIKQKHVQLVVDNFLNLAVSVSCRENTDNKHKEGTL